MAWQKNVVLVPEISNDSLQGIFEFIKTDEDGYGNPIKELALTLIIKKSNGEIIETSRVLVDDHLTAQERTDLNGLLVTLRNAALTAAGFTNT